MVAAGVSWTVLWMLFLRRPRSSFLATVTWLMADLFVNVIIVPLIASYAHGSGWVWLPLIALFHTCLYLPPLPSPVTSPPAQEIPSPAQQQFVQRRSQRQREGAAIPPKNKDCEHCGANREALGSKLRKCACGSVYYCSRECQREGWPTHKEVCWAVVSSWKEKRKPSCQTFR